MLDRILSQYGQLLEGASVRRVNGGFSGAEVWRVETRIGGTFALKRRPNGDAAALELVHQRMNLGLPFVPEVIPTLTGKTIIQDSGVWDLQSWMFGAPVYEPNARQLESALLGLAQLNRHQIGGPTYQTYTIPCIERRIQAFDWFENLRDRILRNESFPMLHQSMQYLEELVLNLRGLEISDNYVWGNRHSANRFCLCDGRADHFLFTGDELTGIIDFDAMKIDHPAVDLARLLGDWFPHNPARRDEAWFIYKQAAGIPGDWRDFIEWLDQTGVVVGLLNWTRWLLLENRQFADWPSVALRVTELLARLPAGS
jgi:hypothetical protein